MNFTGRNGAHWHVERGSFRPRGVRWSPFHSGSTNRLWRGSGPAGEWLLKWYRYPTPGIHPEPEIARFLGAESFRGVPEYGGHLDRCQDGEFVTVAYVQRWVEGRLAWDYAVENLRAGQLSAAWAKSLGFAAGRLHAALAAKETRARTRNPIAAGGFEAIPWDHAAHQKWIDQLEQKAEELFHRLQGVPPDGVPVGVWERTRRIWVADSGRWRTRVGRLQKLDVRGLRSRIHGDLHLGQFLERACERESDRWIALDFEGEPLRPLSERRALNLPLRDVAGMWRSFAYAVAVAGESRGLEKDLQQSFLDGWCELMTPPQGDWKELLNALVWEKAICEAVYEIQHRPAWLSIPIDAL